MRVSAARPFLTADWRNLVMLNYEVDAGLLRRFVPRGVELDCWSRKNLLSLVGYQFLRTKEFGFEIPWHVDFEEVNLRFYVRREAGGEVRRGVVFVREIVPRRAIAFVARVLYNENYVALPMSHEIAIAQDGTATAGYQWKSKNVWNEIRFESEGQPALLLEGSEEQFVTEHHWGYAAQRDGSSVEYQVTHPAWKVCRARKAEFSGNCEELYGREFAAVLREKPCSAFLAEGSAVVVMRGRRI
jgi:uncharacterized protein